MGVILDSSAVIAVERRGGMVGTLIEEALKVAGDQDAALSAVGLTELVHGVHRSPTLALREQRQRFLNELLDVVTVYPYTKEAGLLAGRIDAEQKSRGVTIPFADLLIGATALALGYSVLTVNLRHFKLIPGLKILELR